MEGGINIKDLRSWINVLEKKSKIYKISKAVRPEYEIAAVIKKLEAKGASYFSNISGHNMPLIANVCGSRQLFAEALGVPEKEMTAYLDRAARKEVKCKPVSGENAPVKEQIIHGKDIDLLKQFPIPVHHEKDGGPYITAGVLIVKDPQTGVRNLSIHRLQVLDKNKLGVLILPRHLAHAFDKQEKENKPLDVAIAIGLDPVILLASQAIQSIDEDELMFASALKDEPVEVVKCDYSDLEVPARAEIIMEGKLLPNKRQEEGPFGEFPKYYGAKARRPVIELDRITHRRNPVFQTILPATREHLLLGGIPREASLFKQIKRTVPTVQDVHLTFGGVCRYHLVVSIDKRNEGEAKNAMLAAFSNNADIKHVVVVDGEVDIFALEEVEWAVATRSQADKDILIINNSLGSKLDPSTDNGMGAKMGIDATVPLEEKDRYEKITIPDIDNITIEEYLDKDEG